MFRLCRGNFLLTVDKVQVTPHVAVLEAGVVELGAEGDVAETLVERDDGVWAPR